MRLNLQFIWSVFLLGLIAIFCNCEGSDNDFKQNIYLEVENNSTVKLTLFYEALCPYSIDFFNQQLTPAFKLLHNYIKLDLLPYGNAKQTHSHGRWNFTCQHGKLECEYNKLQACTIKVLKHQNKYFDFIACLMKDKNETQNLSKCADKYSIDLTEINKCRESRSGDSYLAKLGKRTHNFKPQIQGVPTVAFNNVYTEKDQDDALNNLKKVVCRHLSPRPKACKK